VSFYIVLIITNPTLNNGPAYVVWFYGIYHRITIVTGIVWMSLSLLSCVVAVFAIYQLNKIAR
jgi:hypothetical protein